jgi:hypothetical protein
MRPMDDLLNFGLGGRLELWLRIHGRAFCVDCASLLDPEIWAKRQIPNHRRYAMAAWRRTRWSTTIRKVTRCVPCDHGRISERRIGGDGRPALRATNREPQARMADFAKWVTAAEQTLGWHQGSFVSAYSANRKEAEGAALECNAVASAILTMIQAQGSWESTTADLITFLRKRYPAITEGGDAFPRQPAAFGTELRRLAPLLRSRGVTVTLTRTGKERRRVAMLHKSSRDSCRESSVVAGPHEQTDITYL